MIDGVRRNMNGYHMYLAQPGGNVNLTRNITWIADWDLDLPIGEVLNAAKKLAGEGATKEQAFKGCALDYMHMQLEWMPSICIRWNSEQPRVQLVYLFAPSISIWSLGLMCMLIFCAKSCQIITICKPGSKRPGLEMLLPKVIISCRERS